MSRWFRFYTEALDDPKVQRLDGETFKLWVNLLCLTAKHDGTLPSVSDIAFALRIDEIACQSLLDRLLIAGLIDTLKGGINGFRIAPHGWSERQYKSDTSTDRVKRFRERHKNVSETAPDTETDTDTDTEIKETKAKKAPKGVLKPADVSDEVWSDFLAHRKRVRADLTNTALQGIMREAEKAGWTLEAALAECVVRGWRGFKAEWVTNGGNGNGKNDRGGGADRRSSLARAIDEGLEFLS